MSSRTLKNIAQEFEWPEAQTSCPGGRGDSRRGLQCALCGGLEEDLSQCSCSMWCAGMRVGAGVLVRRCVGAQGCGCAGERVRVFADVCVCSNGVVINILEIITVSTYAELGALSVTWLFSF